MKLEDVATRLVAMRASFQAVAQSQFATVYSEDASVRHQGRHDRAQNPVNQVYFRAWPIRTRNWMDESCDTRGKSGSSFSCLQRSTVPASLPLVFLAPRLSYLAPCSDVPMLLCPSGSSPAIRALEWGLERLGLSRRDGGGMHIIKSRRGAVAVK